MGYSKTELFNGKLVDNAKVFKALSHPARLQILQYLANTPSCITGDISHELPLKRTTVNQHLKELKAVGLIQGHIDGAKTKYCLDQDLLKEISLMVNRFLESLKVDNYICD